ncbi:hypothetical protein AUK22_10130 [bacterium CG2_30_54_10]|nr:MAG: hypothetical protein AUK22_10130 [bacterium CG2_30_54_10]
MAPGRARFFPRRFGSLLAGLFLVAQWSIVSPPVVRGCSMYAHAWRAFAERVDHDLDPENLQTFLRQIAARLSLLGSGSWLVSPAMTDGSAGRDVPAVADGSAGRDVPAMADGSARRDMPAMAIGSAGRDMPAMAIGSGGRDKPEGNGGHEERDVPVMSGVHGAPGVLAAAAFLASAVQGLATDSSLVWEGNASLFSPAVLPATGAGRLWIEIREPSQVWAAWADSNSSSTAMFRVGMLNRFTARVVAMGGNGEIVLIEEIPWQDSLELDFMLPTQQAIGGIWLRRVGLRFPPQAKLQEWMLAFPPTNREEVNGAPSEVVSHYLDPTYLPVGSE